MNVVREIDNLVKISRVLVSVSDKENLETFVENMLEINRHVSFLASGGTHGKIKDVLGQNWRSNLRLVSDYTGQPETQGGLVKTLDFKIYLGLLTETYNSAHQEDLVRARAFPIDMVICNLYPFRETIARPEATPEMARANIDIGGPCMIRAAAKNFHRVAVVVNPKQYGLVIREMKDNNGLEMRTTMMRAAFQHTQEYERAISGYFSSLPSHKILDCYEIH
jgi:phosphoribosylaminoimidazolecarboxamide formyltransferase/IMP cyclohydrolase